MNEEHIAQIRKVIDVLKLSDFSITLGTTNNGPLAFKVPKIGDPHFTLDSVPVIKEVESDLKKIFQML